MKVLDKIWDTYELRYITVPLEFSTDAFFFSLKMVRTIPIDQYDILISSLLIYLSSHYHAPDTIFLLLSSSFTGSLLYSLFPSLFTSFSLSSIICFFSLASITQQQVIRSRNSSLGPRTENSSLLSFPISPQKTTLRSLSDVSETHIIKLEKRLLHTKYVNISCDSIPTAVFNPPSCFLCNAVFYDTLQ